MTVIDQSRRTALKTLGVGGLLLVGGAGTAVAKPGRGDGKMADVRVIHAIPDAPPVDVYVEGGQILDEFAFGAMTGYIPLERGTYNVVVNADIGASTVPVFDEDFTLNANTDYTVVATGTLDDGDDADPELVAYIDDNDPAPADAARVRAVHLSPDAPAVDIALEDGPALIPDLAFREASEYLEVPGGSYTLEIRPAGGGVGSAVYTFDVDLENATTYSAFAIGLLGGSGDSAFSVMPSMDSTSPAKGKAKPTR